MTQWKNLLTTISASVAQILKRMSKERYGSGALSADNWKARWEDEHIGFHKSDVHPMLVRYLDQMVNGKSGARIFYPLCGKSVDMKWLADKGHNIVGVEISDKACEAFFKDNKMEFSTVKRDPFTVYKSIDDKIKLYCGDLFAFNSSFEGKVDGIWDRASLVAINKSDRKKYGDVMTELLADDGRYFLLTFDSKSDTHKGPPHFLSEEDIKEIYDDRCQIENVFKRDVMEARHKEWGCEYFYERIQLLTKKSS